MTKFISSSLTIAEMEARKIRHDSSELWMRAIQPALWLVVFGSALTELRSSQLTNGNYTYLQFMSAGVIAQSVLFVAILYGVRLMATDSSSGTLPSSSRLTIDSSSSIARSNDNCPTSPLSRLSFWLA